MYFCLKTAATGFILRAWAIMLLFYVAIESYCHGHNTHKKAFGIFVCEVSPGIFLLIIFQVEMFTGNFMESEICYNFETLQNLLILC